MSSSSLCLGAVLAIAVILIACAWRRRKTKRPAAEAFSYATPATPRVNEAVGELFAALRGVARLGTCLAESLPQGASADQGLALMLEALGRAERCIGGTPPTYANYLAIHRGLSGTGQALLNAAEAYIAAGRREHQAVDLARGPGGPASGPAASRGNAFIGLGQQLRLVVAGTHRLGAALDVE